MRDQTIPGVVEEKVLKHPVIEVFGPTIQGEGPLVGAPCYFVRMGGCDYRCVWCDSKYAVIPEEVRANAEHLSAEEITGRISDLPGEAEWVILSGGNPVLHTLYDLVDEIHQLGKNVQVETQGTIWRPWLLRVDRVVVSPKPPSSEMQTDFSLLDLFLERSRTGQVSLKVVVFDKQDLLYAVAVHRRYPRLPFFLSVGNDYGKDSLEDLLAKYRWLCERALSSPALRDVRILPQLHVLAWGNARAV